LLDFYVDDLVTGSNSIDQANIIQREVIITLSEAGFNSGPPTVSLKYTGIIA